MYSGGRGYFATLSNERFAQQQKLSYFALENTHWLIVALDTAYSASNLYLNGALDTQAQLPSLSQMAQRARS